MQTNLTRLAVTTLVTGLLTTALWADPGTTEKSLEMKASEVLPASIVSGLNSQVLDPVENDGYLNIYRLKSKFGELKVVSTATLYQRVHEFDMIVQMEKLKGSNEFAKGVEAQAGKAVQGAANLVTDPVGTTKKAFSGLGRMFQNVGNTLGGRASSEEGGNMIADASGFSKVERAYAAQFTVDPYSRNPYLQTTLKDISRAGFLGGAFTSLGLGAVSGGAGAFITASTTADSLSEVVSTKSGQDVAQYNSDKLSKMGVSDDVADLFLRNLNFTITERTAIVIALDSMATTQGRQAFIKFAVLTDNADVASFRRRQAEMYAAYDKKQGPIREFRFFDQFAAALLEDGSVLMIAPVDHLLWTDEIASYVGSVNQHLASQASPRKLLWLSGTASRMARQNLAKAGWQIQEKAADRLK